MSASLVSFLAAVIFGAVALVVHLAVLSAVLRAPDLSLAWRLGALVPPVTPIAAWRAGKRFAALAWASAILVYVVVRVVGSYVA